MRVNMKKCIKNLLIFEIVYMILINFVCYFLKLPIIIKNLVDIINIFIIFYEIVNFNEILHNKNIKKINIILFISAIFLLTGYFINSYSIFNFVWGLRTILRILIVFYGVILTFEKDDIELVFGILNKMFIINVFICLFQFFILDWKQDLLGGTFSNGNAGGNAGLLAILFFESIYITIMYLNGKIKISKFLIYTMLCLVLAALAELKLFFILYFVILIFSLFISNKSFKTISTVIFGALLFVIGVSILIKIFPQYSNWFNISRIISSFNSPYTVETDFVLSRGNAIREINDYFFKNNFIYNVFGYGLGNCIKSSINIFNIDFFNKYGFTHYNWFFHSFVYIETGFGGLILSYLFLSSCFIKSFKNAKNNKSNNENINGKTILIIIFLMIVTTVYNSFLLTDAAYFIFVILALPYINNDNIHSKVDTNERKKMYLFACVEKNIGDDLFIYTVINRYKDIDFIITEDASYLQVNNFSNLIYSRKIKKWLKISNNASNNIVKRTIIDLIEKIYSISIKRLDSIYIVGNAFKNMNYQGHYQIQWLERRIKKSNNFYLLSTNYGPSNSEKWIEDCASAFSKMTDICFRDINSYKLFSELKNVRYAPDAVLTLKIKKNQKNIKKNYIIFSVIDCKMKERNVKLKNNANLYEKKMVSLINYFTKSNFNIVLLNSNVIQDNPASKRIYDKCNDKNKVSIYDYDGNINGIFKLFNNAKAVIATRLHTIILGWLYDIPVVPFIYDIKVKNILDSYNFDGLIENIDNLRDMDVSLINQSIENYSFKVSNEILLNANNQFAKLDEMLNKGDNYGKKI